MGNSKRLNITVPQEDYEEWNDAVEDEHVAPSLSELIRQSVNRSLDGALSDGSQSQQEVRDTGASEDVLAYLERIDGTLTDVEKRLERLESESRASSKSGGVDLQKVVHSVLPKNPIPETVPQEVIEEEYEDSKAMTADDVARRIEADVDEIVDALLKLEPRDPSVVSFEADDGTTYWWREE